MTELKLYNTLTRTKEEFVPEDPKNVRMYVCGPTVYDFAHIGNARPVIVFDVLFRLLRHVYGEEHVTYVRNITDVDDKINTRALRDFPDLPLNEAIRNVTEKTANQFHADVKALGCLEPTHEPRATEHIEGMASMIQTLLDKGHAYVAKGEQGREVLFRVASMAEYGKLSNRKLEDQQAGARVAVESHKENPGDFVLWKESNADEPGWDGTFNGETIHGRPGWHIECSVMSKHHLGETFDIHGGGLDLIFPHHENEIAQSCCAHGTDKMASVWMHNGYLQVEGKKMSKSEGNFVTIHDLLDSLPGDIVRMQMLETHYRQPMDWRDEKNDLIRDELEDWYRVLRNRNWLKNKGRPSKDFIEALADDLNTVDAIAVLRRSYKEARDGKDDAKANFWAELDLIGFQSIEKYRLFERGVSAINVPRKLLFENLEYVVQLRAAVANTAPPQVSTSLVEKIRDSGIDVEFGSYGAIKLISNSDKEGEMEQKISQRLDLLRKADSMEKGPEKFALFDEADKIRDELAAQGIQLKDSKDSETGERITTWEVKR